MALLPATSAKPSPFFVVEQQGRLTCGEECRDVLSSLLRREERAPEGALQAFDARQLRLSEEKGAPHILWHTSSLLQVVVSAVRVHPLLRSGCFDLRRFIYATSALGALGCRGLDPDRLVRRGMARIIKLGIAGWLSELERSNSWESWEHRDQWKSFFEESGVDGTGSLSYIKAALTGRASQGLDSWIESAPLEDVLLWRPPDQLPNHASAASPDEVEVWTWLVERFTQTYLDRWSLVSLKKEYAFARGLWHPGFSADLLRERVIAGEKVATALADRAVLSEDVIDPAVLSALTEQAAALLDEGQRTAAAALFDSARMLKPTDMMAQNNYAYCILVDKPQLALALLRDALNRGIETPAVTLCNIAFAESLLGNYGAAVDACRRAGAACTDHQAAYLWKRSDEDWISVYTSVRAWITEFAASLERLGDASGERSEQL